MSPVDKKQRERVCTALGGPAAVRPASSGGMTAAETGCESVDEGHSRFVHYIKHFQLTVAVVVAHADGECE